MATVMDHLASSPTSTINRSDAYELGDITLQSNNTNIDHIAYYSSDYDRYHREASPKNHGGFMGLGIDIPGIPKSGIYAHDGLWDEEDTISDSTTLRPASGSTVGTGSRRRQSSKPTPPTLSANGSIRSRGRSGTISSMSNGNPGRDSMDEKGGPWLWTRKSNPSTPNMPETEILPTSKTLEVKEKRESRLNSLRKERSRSRLRGKGRKGELSVAVTDPDESFEAPPPLPPTPASFITASSPAMSTGSLLSPRHLPSRMIFDQENSPLAPASVDIAPKSSKSSWKRGMEKIFRSKSSVALREAFNMADPNQPAVPRRPDGLPKAHDHPLGPAFSSSTPPMPSHDSQKDAWGLYGSIYSPPTTATSATFGFTQPTLPPDPFASSMDSSSSRIPRSPSFASPPSRQSLTRNSPSLRDLKNFLAPKSELIKAKSLANIRERISEPLSASPLGPCLVEQPLPAARVPKRVKSAMGLNLKVVNPLDPIGENATLHPLPRPRLNRMPTESPPLVAPQPPFFSTSGSSSAPSSPSAPSMTMDLSLGAMTPPPTTPLPAPPVSSPMTHAVSSPVKRSASGAVLLPRSRSTSMSLNAPPTSSSFFDLYEQLGIWPTSSSEKSTTREASTERAEDRDPAPVEEQQTSEKPAEEPIEGWKQGDITMVSESPSATFSLGSWEAAISAFPMVDGGGKSPRFSDAAKTSMDFGEPIVADPQGMDNLLTTSPIELIDEPKDGVSDGVMDRMSNCSSTHGGNQSASIPTSQAATSTTTTDGALSNGFALSTGMSRGGTGMGGSGGSEHSSRAGSRDERHRNHVRGRRKSRRGSSTSSSDNDNEEDDLPLSHLHPQAAAQQRDKADRKAARRSAKVKSQGRNPGAGSGWNGEGGVPLEVLTRKLQALQLKGEERRYPWQIAAAAGPSRQRTLELSTKPVPTAIGSVPAQRSHNEPIWEARLPDPERSRQRQPSVQSITRPDQSGRGKLLPSPHLAQVLRQVSEHAAPRPAPGQLSANASPASQSSRHVPSAVDLARNDTQRSTISATRGRSRNLSNADSIAHVSETSHRKVAVESPRPALNVPAVIGHLGGARTMLEVHHDTTARDVLHLAQQRGQLAEPAPGLGWVVVEIFGELGCERHIREYETVLSVVQGWDRSVGKNTLLLCQSNRAASTWARQSIPSTAPFLGCYVQYETKKGKWTKKYLETRGGQVFLAKNEKNKDEVQLNTLFHDVYSMPRPKGAPKPFVFTMKRNEPASALTDPQEYTHTFSVEEQIGWKLFAAIYDAKSVAMAQTMPQVLAPTSSAPMPRKRTETEGSGPLIDLIKEKKEERSGFTGKGLLKI